MWRGRRLRWQGPNATVPLVELRIRDGRVLVRLRWAFLRALFSRFMPEVDVPLNEVRVDPIKATLGGGVRLTTANSAGVIFWTFSQQGVIDALLAGGARLGEPDFVL